MQKLEKWQKEYMAKFWEAADVEIKGNEALQQGLHFNLFHIIQSAGRDGKTGMGAKGLSGEGYEGHYFWDTEMYVLPVLVYTRPVAKRLLDYRFRTLDQARERARILGHEKGHFIRGRRSMERKPQHIIRSERRSIILTQTFPMRCHCTFR